MPWSATAYIPEGVTLKGSLLEQEFLQNPTPAQERTYDNKDESPDPVEWFERSTHSPLCLWTEHSWGRYPGDEAVSVEFEESLQSVAGLRRLLDCLSALGVTRFVFGRSGERHHEYDTEDPETFLSRLEDYSQF